MCKESEQALEDKLIRQLEDLDYKFVQIKDENDLYANLKTQLEIHNKTSFTDKEFERILNHLNRGNVFEKAKVLRDKFQLDRCDGSKSYIEFIQQDEWCRNEFQVTNQITIEGTYKNRYDVTLLVNGLPLVQIELKRRGLELKEAFNQINRYQRHSFWASNGLFQYIQIFVISNGVNSKYYANNRKQSFKQTFFWCDDKNNQINRLEDFTKKFLERCHLSKMICKYIVLNEADKILMVLRPYQYYAVEAIIDRVKHGRKNGYIWHTTGSGKTLTSFKTSQLLIEIPKVQRVVFVVDRKDLDYQTQREFDSFSKGSVDASKNTHKLVEQFNEGSKLIVTTIQKLNNAIHHNRYLSKMEEHRGERVIFIFDECHRSQFGDTHKRIKKFFERAQMFGFTGTPIFADNAVKNEHGKRTTKELFDECLHQYIITNAIKDENVLKFSVEYIGKYIKKESARNNIDIEVEGIDSKELMESPKRIGQIADYILANHSRKTHAREFTAIFCVNSVECLIKYYEIFKQRKKDKKHNLKIATIFSYTANEDDKDANGMIETDFPGDSSAPVNKHTRDKLEEFIGDYNKMFKSKYTTKDSQSYYNYYQDIGKKVRERRIDILLVVNMFLTGFDSKPLNTLYVDKNLKFHGLIQAFSRTNRILNEQKSQGNIVCFRNLKKATDTAIALFSNKDAKEIIIMEPYEKYVEQFNNSFVDMLKITPTVNSVSKLPDENKEMDFIKAFRELMRLRNILRTFVDFSWNDLSMTEQLFEDYKSKYLDLYDKVKTDNQKEKVSILEDVDFELELLHRDEINVAYILKLLANLKFTDDKDYEDQKKQIIDTINSEASLRSKRELIEKFIENNLPTIEDPDSITDEFESYWTAESQKALEQLCQEENLDITKLQETIDNYLYSGRKPGNDDALALLKGTPPKLLQRRKIGTTITSKIISFVEKFINGIA